jgi:minor extracellular protease Epr
VAVVDTGIANHEDLIISGGVAYTGYTTSYSDDNGHGTHVAGIIAARNNGIGTVGMAPDASLFAVKVLDGAGSGYLSDVVAGIDWSISNKMDIVNLSLGTSTDSSALKQIVDKAYNNGIILVAAAGNSGTADGAGDTINYPAKYPSVIAVGATQPDDTRASFSSTGNTLEVAAPGVGVLSTYPGNRYAKMSGTSMATPYVAGNLALFKEANSSLASPQLRGQLQASVVDLGVGGKDAWFGYGLIQAPQGEAPAAAPGEEETTPIAPAPEEEAVSPPAEEPKQIATVTYVYPAQDSYKVGETVKIYAEIFTTTGLAVGNAKVTLTITPPRGRRISYVGQTDAQGKISFNYQTKKNTPKGSYGLQAVCELAGYQSSRARGVFYLQ